MANGEYRPKRSLELALIGKVIGLPTPRSPLPTPMTFLETLGRHRLEVNTRGAVRFDVEPTNSRHRHDFTEICLVLQGTGRYVHGDGEYPLRPGDVFTADPGVVHEISSHATRDLEIWFLTLGIQTLEGHVATVEDAVVERYQAAHRTHAPGHGALSRYLPLIDEKATGLERAAAGAATRYLALSMLQALAGAPTTAASPKAADPVELALAYIDARNDRPLGVEEVAAAAGLSPRALRRRFVSQLGVGLAEEINHRRMRRAAHLLLMGFSVAETGRQVGIDAPAQFTRAFRRALGTTPKAFQADYVSGRTTRP